MASARLSRRRQELLNSRSLILVDNGTAFNQFEQIVPLAGNRHHSSKNKTQRPNLIDWYHSTRKATKRFTNPSLSIIGQGRPHSSDTALSISQLHLLTENNNELLDLNHYQAASIVPSTISLANQDQQRINSTYPESILTGPRTLNERCSCSITMRYRSDPNLPSMSSGSRRDEVMIFQVANNGSNWTVFKGFLKMDDSFTFKSQRSVDDRFHLKLEINGSLDTTISACCEHSYRRGGRIDDDDSSFWIESVEQYTSCTKCGESIDLSQASDDETEVLALPSVIYSKSKNASNEESETEEEDQSVASKESTEKLVSITPAVQSSPHPPPPSTVLGPTLSASGGQAKPADNGSTLFEYVNSMMKQALSKPKPSQTILPRSIGNVENFTILHINQNEETDLSLLRPAVNFVRIIHDPNTLGTLLASCTDEKVIVVMSLKQAETLLPEFQQHKCIQSIYFLSKQTHLPEWINHYDKAIGIYRNIESIRDDLVKTLPHVASRAISMEITSDNSTSDQPFTYCQLLKETMLCQDDESDLRKDMLAFCRIHYAHNQEASHEIDEFEKSFTDAHSIEWYTRHSFLTKILSRAFRTQEIDLLFKMRYFIQCLHKQIQSNTVKNPTTVYAILDVEQETIQKFKENINGLVLFRSFLFTTFERPTSTEDQNKDTKKYLVISIRFGPNCAANIEQLRSSTCKFDILINIDTVFRIVSINRDENSVQTVSLEFVLHDDSHFQELTAPSRKGMQAPVVILQLTKLLLATHHYYEANYITELVDQDKSFENDGTLLASLAAANHLLGNVDVNKRDFEAARYQFFKALRAFQSFLPHNHSMLSSTYNNIGNMYYQEDQHERAIKFHEMALECQLKASNPDMDSIATYSTNIGAVYIDEKNYMEALKHLKRAAMITEKMTMKDNTKSLISIFQKISSCFWNTKEFKEALEYYKKILSLQLKLPDPLPHPLSVTYYNLSTAYARIGDYNEAVVCAEKSIQQLNLISADHPELKENQAQLEIVRQKQWLKEVLSA